MALFPNLRLGWLNGWVLLAFYYLVFGILMSSFPKGVVARLYDRSGWTNAQRQLSAIGGGITLAWFGLMIFTPLKVGKPVFILGLVVYGLGLLGLVIALHNYRDTPMGEPVVKGLYRVSRNPQWLGLAMGMLGIAIATGSGIGLLLMGTAIVFYHFRILAEEEACLVQYGESYRAYMRDVPRYFLFF